MHFYPECDFNGNTPNPRPIFLNVHRMQRCMGVWCGVVWRGVGGGHRGWGNAPRSGKMPTAGEREMHHASGGGQGAEPPGVTAVWTL